MKLPVIRVAGNERWDCQACGVCCRGPVIRLSHADLKKIEDQHWDRDPEFSGQQVLIRESNSESGYRLARQADGACVFLTGDGRCRIHEKFGSAAKPLPCRLFPLQLIPRGKDTVLTLRRACPTAAADEGRPLGDHLPEIKRLLASGELTISGPRVAEGRQLSWQHANRVLAAVSRLFSDERYPPVRRVIHALLFGKMLARPKLARLNSGEFENLIALIEPTVMEDAGAFFKDRRPPSRFAHLLFRLTAAEYVRLHPDYRPPSGFFKRGKLLRWSLRFARGRGPLPAVSERFGPGTFDMLEAPLGSLHAELTSPEFQRPIERFLTTSAASYQYALAHRRGWSVWQSICALAMSFPLALYLLRWGAVGREPSVTDVTYIVSALDRAQGFPSLSGGRYRRVLNLLQWHGDLERLVVWYAR
jgi:lysine-N-methylase